MEELDYLLRESVNTGKLDICCMGLTDLPPSSIWSTLKYLDCTNNNLRKLPPLPSLEILHCSSNYLTELSLPPSLRVLICNDNKLVEIPPLPALSILHCNINNLTSLPPMPMLTELYCSYNSLTALPYAPRLRILSCAHNRLAILPYMPRLIIETSSGNPLLYNSRYNNSVHAVRHHLLLRALARRGRRALMRRRAQKWRAVLAAIECRPPTGRAFLAGLEYFDSLK